ncbi:MAG TPA: phosphate uptake regulator PhoU [Egibacteraceae bacterium]|jgi:phosphate transport system protein|nr:phosphate uptake regulator PhoU [Egibacteraceae bacterium]
MIWRQLFGADSSGLERIEQHLLDMLDADRRTLELAREGLLGHTDPDTLRQQVSDSDYHVNELVQQVRRQLVIHASTHGTATDIPALLVTMSIVKDIERIGDYAKELLRIARVAGPFPPGTPSHERLAAACHQASGHLSEVRAALDTRDPDVTNRLLATIQTFVDGLDEALDTLLTTTPGEDSIAVALASQYVKRIGAHLSNILTSIVLPVDQLDFYDEDQPPQ